MFGAMKSHVKDVLEEINEGGLYKEERIIETPQRAKIGVSGGKEVVNFCANNYLGLADDTWMAVQKVEVIPLEVVLRNVATGSLCKQTPIPAGTALEPALLDLYYKDDAFGDPLLTDARLELLQLVTTEQRAAIEALARRVNAVLVPFFRSLDLQLVDFKLELGCNAAGELVVADEISPDTCRLWDLRTSDPQERILDKDRFRQDLGGVIEAYGEVCKRVQGACPNPRNCR